MVDRTPIYLCPLHGLFRGDDCPGCEDNTLVEMPASSVRAGYCLDLEGDSIATVNCGDPNCTVDHTEMYSYMLMEVLSVDEVTDTDVTLSIDGIEPQLVYPLGHILKVGLIKEALDVAN